MHEAYEAFPILERLPLEIESLTAYDGNLVVGTRQGHLLMYSVGETGAQADVQLLRSNKNFSRRPINQVAVVPHHQILISLSDSLISIHDLTVYNFPLLSTMNNTKGATTFDLEIMHHVSLTGETAVTVRLAVVVRRKLQLYYWKARQFQPLQNDIALTDIPRQILWCGGAVVMDQCAGYLTVQLSGAQSAVLETSRSCEMSMVSAGKAGVALQVSSNSLVLQDTAGQAAPPTTLAWTAAPTATVYQSPFVIGVVGKQLEVVSAEENIPLQTLPLSKPRLLVPDVVTNARATCGPRLFCASLSHVWCLKGISSANQIPSLLSNNCYTLALRLLDTWGCSNTDDRSSTAGLREHIHKLHAFYLFCRSRFQEALDTFLEIDTELLFVIGLFPALVPEDCQRQLQYPSPPPLLTPPNLHTALTCLIDYLLKKRRRLVSSLEKRSRSSSRESTPTKTRSSPANAKRRGALHQQLQVVDTTLLKCYLQERPGLVGPLLRFPDGRVSLAEGERLLREHNRLPDFLSLLFARGQHTRALKLLHQHQHTTQPSPLTGPKELVKYLQNMGPEHVELLLENCVWLVHHHPLEALRVFTGSGAAITDAEMLPRYRIVDFLKLHQPRLAILYLEYLINEWTDKSSGLHNELIKQYRDVLVEHSGATQCYTNTPAVRQTDRRTEPNNSRTTQGDTEADALGNRTTDEDSRITDEAVDENSISIGTIEDSRTSVSKEAATRNSAATNNVTELIENSASRNNNSSNNLDNSSIRANMKESKEIEYPSELRFEQCSISQKLLSFLRSSTHYTPATVLLCLADHDCLVRGRATVLGVLGQHRQALQLYITTLHDLPAALKYCHQYYHSTGTASQVYLMLLELLIRCDNVAALLKTQPCSNSFTDSVSSPIHNKTSNSDTKPSDTSSSRNESDSSRNEYNRSPVAGLLQQDIINNSDSCDGDGSRPASADSSDNAKFDMLLNLLHTYATFIRLKPAVQLLPDSVPVREVRGFLQCWLRQFAADKHKTVLQRGVAQAVTRQVSSDLCAAQSNKITLSTQRFCCICKKRLTKFSAFVCSPSGAVCHFSCRERLHSSWLQQVKQAQDKQARDARTRAAVAAAIETL